MSDENVRLPNNVKRVAHVDGAAHAADDVDGEIAFHLTERADEFVRAGATREEAERRARAEFGDVEATRRELAALDLRRKARKRRADWWTGWGAELLHACRGFARAPAFSGVVVLTLALGIGASTAVFAVIEAALIRPLPYAQPERLVHIMQTKRDNQTDLSEASYPDLVDWRARTTAFSGLEGYDETNLTLRTSTGADRIRGARVTSGFFALLGVTPITGRVFNLDDWQSGGAPVAVVTDAFWRTRMGGRTDVLGSTLDLDGRPYSVIGVLRSGFSFAAVEDSPVWIPLDPAAQRVNERFNHWVRVVGRLRGGVTIDRARTELGAVMVQLANDYPETNRGRGVSVVPLREALVGDVKPALLAVFAAAALVMLIACANVASLLLVRMSERASELAVRGALGASRWRVTRQLLSESIVLAIAGGALGIGVAVYGVRAIMATIPDASRAAMPYLEGTGVNWVVLAVAAAAVLSCGILFGVAPARVAMRHSLSDLIRSGGRGTTGNRAHARSVLVVAELALTFTLLVSAGLLVRSLTALLETDIGVRPSGVLTGRIAISGSAYAEPRQRQLFFETLMERARAFPGVDAVGAVSNLPLNGGSTNTFRVEGAPEPDPAARYEAVMRGVGGDYFRAMSIPLLAGRAFAAGEDSTRALAVVISESIARALFPDGRAVGGRLRFYAFPESAWTVIGVVGNVRTGTLDATPPPTIYYSHLQAAETKMSLAIHTAGDPRALVPLFRLTVGALDPTLPVFSLETMQEAIERTPAIAVRRYPLALIGAFGATALLLAIIGIYGVMSHHVAAQTRAIGIRAALGADRRRLHTMVLRDALLLGATGIAAGWILAFSLTRGFQSWLVGVGNGDVAVYATASAVVVAAAMLSAWLPAQRAAGVDPMKAMRTGE